MSQPQIKRNTPGPGSLELFYALNAIAIAIHQSLHGESNVYSIFQEQVIALSMRGGISELDAAGNNLLFKTVAFTDPIRKMLNRFEKNLKTSAVGYSIPVDQVDVYRTVIREGRAVFVPDTSTVAAQVVPRRFKGVVAPLLRFLGRPPGIFAPLVYYGQISGMLNMVGPNLNEMDVPTMKAFASQIAIALENSRLAGKLQANSSNLEVTSK